MNLYSVHIPLPVHLKNIYGTPTIECYSLNGILIDSRALICGIHKKVAPHKTQYVSYFEKPGHITIP